MGVWKLELLETLNDIAQEANQESWDNGGVQIDLGDYEIKRILVALEVTTEVMKEANELAADYLVVHHPLFFQSIHSLEANDVTGSFAVDLIQAGIGVYASHTAFDKAERGTNGYLAKKLGLTDIKPLVPCHPEEGVLGVKGVLHRPVSLWELGERFAVLFEEDPAILRFVGDSGKMVSRVAIITGSGGNHVKDAILNGCDILITGDVKYHDACLARETGLAMMDGGHFGTEKFFVQNMVQQLSDRIGNKVEIVASKALENPFWVMKK
jgi:dinuclear metal center YbgI/SA1388 family protein